MEVMSILGGDFKRRRLEEPGYGTSALPETSEMAGNAVLKRAGTGDVDENWAMNRKMAIGAIGG